MEINVKTLEAIRARALSLIPAAVPVKEVKAPTEESKDLIKAKAAIKIIKENFHTNKHRGLAHIVAALLGQKVSDIYDGNTEEWQQFRHVDDETNKGQAIVMIGNVNSHDYILHRPAFLKGTEHGYCYQFQDNGEINCGNHAPTTDNSRDPGRLTWRFATVEEINAEIDRVKKFLPKEKPAEMLAGIPW